MKMLLPLLLCFFSWKAAAADSECRHLFRAELAYPDVTPDLFVRTFLSNRDRVVRAQFLISDSDSINRVLPTVISHAFRANKPGLNHAALIAQEADLNGQSLLVARDEIIERAITIANRVAQNPPDFGTEHGAKFLDVNYVLGRPIKVSGWINKLGDGSLLCTIADFPQPHLIAGIELLPVSGRLSINPETLLDVKESLNPVLDVTEKIVSRIGREPLAEGWKSLQMKRLSTYAYSAFLSEVGEDPSLMEDFANDLASQALFWRKESEAFLINSITDLKRALLVVPPPRMMTLQEREGLVTQLNAHLADHARKSLRFQSHVKEQKLSLTIREIINLPDERRLMMSWDAPVVFAVSPTGDLDLALHFDKENPQQSEIRFSPILNQRSDAVLSADLMRIVNEAAQAARDYHKEMTSHNRPGFGVKGEEPPK